MNYKLALILSAILINSVHAYLLVAHKSKRKWSISEHALLSKSSFFVYVLGHFLNGAIFLIFAKQYFLDAHHLYGLYYLSIVTVIFEYIQALLPAGGKTVQMHTYAALLMWALFISLGAISLLMLDVEISRKIIAATIYMALLVNLIYAFSNLQRVYFLQMVMVLLFYTSMMVLVF